MIDGYDFDHRFLYFHCTICITRLTYVDRSLLHLKAAPEYMSNRDQAHICVSGYVPSLAVVKLQDNSVRRAALIGNQCLRCGSFSTKRIEGIVYSSGRERAQKDEQGMGLIKNVCGQIVLASFPRRHSQNRFRQVYACTFTLRRRLLAASSR